MAAAQTNAQMHPRPADFQAILATRRGAVDGPWGRLGDVPAGVRKIDRVVVFHRRLLRRGPSCYRRATLSSIRWWAEPWCARDAYAELRNEPHAEFADDRHARA